MSTPPPVPPVADADRYAVYAIGGVSTSYVDVPFPVYGDENDLTVLVDGRQADDGSWSLASRSGLPLSSIAQPITEARVMFWPAVAPTTIEVIGSIRPRQVVMPSSAGIGRREFNYTAGYILSALRELWRSVSLGRSQAFGFDASGPLAQRAQYGDQPKGFRFAQTDDASGRPILYVKLSNTLDDWSQALNFKGEPGAAGAPGAGSLTSLATGYGLKGGPVTTTGSVQFDPTQTGWGLRNRLLNGAMAIDQRNAGAAAALGVVSGVSNYVLDRWSSYIGSAGTGITAQRVLVAAGGIHYAARLQRANTSGTTAVVNHAQVLETAQCVDLQGKKATLSFKARAGANFSGSGGQLNYSISYGTGVDQSAAAFAAGLWTGQAVIASGQIVPVPGGDFAAGALTVDIPAGAKQLAVRFWWTPTGTAGAADFVDIAQVQLEPGAVAVGDVAFEFRPHGLELSLCQRFYAKSYSQGTVPGSAMAGGGGGVTVGNTNGVTNAYTQVQFPVTMRAAPSVVAYDNAGAATKVSTYFGGWTDGVAATVDPPTDRTAIVRFTGAAYYTSFDWTANAEL